MQRLKVNGAWWQFTAPMRDRVPFRTHGALYGTADPIGHGRLPREWWASFDEATMGDGSGYAVYSYQTPIAWCSPTTGWVVPDVRYSVTTSKHQGRIRTAVGALAGEALPARAMDAPCAPTPAPTTAVA